MGFKTQQVTVAQFDCQKFCTRYGVALEDIRFKGATLCYPDTLPDSAADPGAAGGPELDAPDLPATKPQAAIDAIKADTAVDADVCSYLKWLIDTKRLPE